MLLCLMVARSLTLAPERVVVSGREPETSTLCSKSTKVRVGASFSPLA